MRKFFKMVVVIIVMMSTANAQTKSGILKKDNYGDFSADKWEEFLAGQNAAEFEKKSNIKLQDYQVIIEDFVKTKLGEPNTAAAVANSEKVSFPVGADIYTAASDGKTWITRKTYLNETGFYHTPTGTYWLSFKCGNLCLVKDTKVLTNNDLTLKNPSPATNPQVTPNVFYVGGNGNNNCCGEYTKGFDAGFDKRTVALGQDLAAFKELMEVKQSVAIQQPMMQTSGWVLSGGPMVQASLPAQQVVVQQQKIPFGQTWGGQALATAAGVFVGNELSERVNLFGNRYYAQGYNYNYYPRYQQFGPGFQWNGGGGYTDYSGGPIHPATGGRIASSNELIPGAGTGGSNYGAGFQWR